MNEVETCGKDWKVDLKTGHCYQIINTRYPFTGAETACQNLDNEAQLASILSVEDNEFIKEYLVIPNESNNDFWIGLNTGTWTDGSPLVSYCPTGVNCNNECKKISNQLNQRGEWMSEPCNKVNLPICKITARPTTPSSQSYRCDEASVIHDCWETCPFTNVPRAVEVAPGKPPIQTTPT